MRWLFAGVLLAGVAQAKAPPSREVPLATATQHLLVDRFVPLGFSKTGAFAALLAPADEACGCFFGTFLVLDLTTDAVLERIDYHSDDRSSFPLELKAEVPTTLEAFWSAGEATWLEKLRAHGIVLSPLVLSAARSPALQVTAEVTTNHQPDDGVNGTITKYEVRAKTALGSKVVADKIFEAEHQPLAFSLVGVIKSPFEPRVVVVGIEQWRGWEGPPNVVRPVLFGCHLRYGFHDGDAK